jgi:hypothetical protein
MKLIYALSYLCGLLLISFNMQAQSLERKVIASGGASITSPLQVDYTIGEMAVETATVSNSIILTQGFQQPYYVIIPNNNIFPYLVIYPNPAAGNALARFVLAAPAKMTISIYDATGKLMISEQVNYTNGEMQYIIRSRQWAQGSYFIRFALQDGSSVGKQLIKLQ